MRLILTIIILSCGVVLSQEAFEKQRVKRPNPSGISKPLLRYISETEKTTDPATGLTDQNALIDARSNISKKTKNPTGNIAIPGTAWVERGPNNIGGRTRALMFDPNDATNKKVWAGGVAGGLWYNNDITLGTSVWNKIDDFWDNLAISCIAVHPASSNTFYVGTGEGFFNIDAVGGGGIWKTTDGGATWTLLTATVPNFASSATTLQKAFKYVQDIEVLSDGTVIVASNAGVLRSTDGGGTWSIQYSSNNFTDLERGTDNILYAGVRATSLGKVWKSTDNGVTWTDISPSGLPSGYRTEIALAPSTSGASQVVYAVAAGNSTHGWFIKSIDGGVNWTTITAGNFSESQGWYDLILKVHPTNPNLVIAGGTNFIRTINGGSTWSTNNYSAHGHPDMHAVVFRPGAANEAIYGSDGGVYYSTDFGNSAGSFPTSNIFSRNNGYNVTQLYSVAAKNLVGKNYFIGGTQDNGTFKVSGSGVGSGSSLTGGDGMLSFIDQDEPNIQISSYQWNNYTLLDSLGVPKATLIDDGDGAFINPADYDWKRNILYTYKATGKLKRVLNVGSSNDTSTINLGTAINSNVIKVGYALNTLFIANGSTLYKVVNVNTSPYITQINVGSGMSGNISCIELGANDNEILVTLSNYNTTSVFYSNDGGGGWSHRDLSGYGLPNIPVRYALFNPKNRDQVLLATELGVWSTNNFSATNPGWEITSTNLAKVRCDMLRYRSSDGLVAVGTHGRGVFTSNTFSSVVTPEIVITSPINPSYCTNSTIKAAFIASGSFNTGNQFQLQLSDATGSFTSPTILGSSSVSPIYGTIPGNTQNSSMYQIRIVATNTAQNGTPLPIQISTSNALNLYSSPYAAYALDRSFMLKASTTNDAVMYYNVVADGDLAPSLEQINIGINAELNSPFKAGSFNTASLGFEAEMMSGLPSGKAYDIYSVIEDQSNGCFSPITKRDVSTTGTLLNYTAPAYSPGCINQEILMSLVAFNGEVFSQGENCSGGSFNNHASSVVNLSSSLANSYYISTIFDGGWYYTQGISIWIDTNHNGIFDTSEMVLGTYINLNPNYSGNFSFASPSTIKPGITKMRIRSTYGTFPTDPNTNLSSGEAEDFWVNITDGPGLQEVHADISVDSSNSGGNLKVYFEAQGLMNGANVFDIELSDATGSFTSPTVLLTGYNGFSPASVTIPSNTPAGTAYKVRVKASNPAITGFASYPFKIVNDCPTVRTITAAISNQNQVLKASSKVISDQAISGTSNITFKSQAFELNPGFIAENGVIFMTEIGGCN